MSGNAPVVGIVCTVIGLFFSLYVYVDTALALTQSAEATGDLNVIAGGSETENPWVRGEVITLLVGAILAIILLIAWIPVVLIEMSCCCCLSTIKETVVKTAFKAKGKIIKIIIAGLSLIVFALVLIYTIHAEIINKKFEVLRNGIMSVVASVFFLVNFILTLIYLRG